jgi:glucosyl-dolichyl phosphate glucuronosyltransferase
MNLSVVICTFNRSDSLAKVLGSLSVQLLPAPVEWEVLVLDNNSWDKTREVAQRFCDQFPKRFRYVFEPQQGKSFALNRGIREANGDIVAFTDDDVVLEACWLHHLTMDLVSGEWAGAGGRTLPEKGFMPPRWLALEKRYALAPLAIFDMGTQPCELDEPPFGNNMAFRKTILERYSGFRTDLGPCAGSYCPQKSEDSEFGTRLLLAGERIIYKSNAIVYHGVPQQRLKKAYFLKWWLDKARSDVQAFGVQDQKWCVFGVPMRLIRRLAAWTLRWMVAVEPGQRFDCKLKVWALIGEIWECCRRRFNVKDEKGCDERI